MPSSGRVATRWLQGGGLEELPRSLHGLVRSNGGRWKSEAQARFLLRLVAQVGRNPSPEMLRWAHAQPEYDADQFVVGFTQFIEGFGHQDPTKVRYSGSLFLVDGQGVVVRAKAKVQHQRPSEGEYVVQLLPETAEVDFRRAEGSGHSFDIRDELRREEAETRTRIETNRPTVEKIKAVRDWESNSFLVSIVSQLERGGTLSEKQKVMLDRIVPVDVAFDPEPWAEIVRENDRILGEMVIPALVEGERALAVRLNSEDYSDEVSRWWAGYAHSGRAGMDWGDGQGPRDLIAFLDLVDPRPLIRFHWQYTDEVAAQMAKAVAAMRKGKAPTKKATDYYTYHVRLNRRLKTLTSSTVEKIIAQMWA